MSSVLQFLIAVTYIAVICYLAYKMTAFIMDKMVDLIFDSANFRVGFCLFLSLAFFAIGVWQLSEYMKETDHSYLDRLFPLSMSASALLLFLGIWVYKHEDQNGK